MTLDDLWAARRERARRWVQAGGDLRGYPALAAEDEIEATLAAEPTKQAGEKKLKPQPGELMATLAEYIAALAVHIAHERGWALEQATRWVENHIAEARKEYRTLGAPLGDTDQGFLAWLAPRPQPPTA